MSNDVIRNPDFWNQLYIDKDTGWDIGQPTPIFVNWSKTLNPKLKILIPGCGNCYDGIYLSKQNVQTITPIFLENSIPEEEKAQDAETSALAAADAAMGSSQQEAAVAQQQATQRQATQ